MIIMPIHKISTPTGATALVQKVKEITSNVMIFLSENLITTSINISYLFRQHLMTVISFLARAQRQMHKGRSNTHTKCVLSS